MWLVGLLQHINAKSNFCGSDREYLHSYRYPLYMENPYGNSIYQSYLWDFRVFFFPFNMVITVFHLDSLLSFALSDELLFLLLYCSLWYFLRWLKSCLYMCIVYLHFLKINKFLSVSLCSCCKLFWSWISFHQTNSIQSGCHTYDFLPCNCVSVGRVDPLIKSVITAEGFI